MTLSRRNILGGLIATLTAPAIVKYSSLMPVRGIVMPVEGLMPIMATPLQLLRKEIAEHGHFLITGYNEWGERVIETIELP
jgi:hypothetical protein